MTNQELLELISGYIPYRPKCQWLREDDKELVVQDLTISDYNFLITRHHAKLALRPLSSLYERCLEDNKVPIIELAEMAFPDEGWFLDYNNNCKSFKDNCIFAYDKYEFQFYCDNYEEAVVPCRQLQLFKWLYKHHFDIEGLIEKGYAVNINTLNDK